MTVAPPGPVASAVMSAGSVSVGAVVSWTVTSNVPDAGRHVTGTLPSTASSADGEKVTAAPAGPVASSVMSPGSVSTGACVSDTFTVNILSALLPAASLAEQVTVVSMSSGKVSPDA